MQNFTIVKPGEIVADSLLKINNSIETVASNFSGTAFPTDHLIVGMSCYREDLGKKYTLKSINPIKWEADNSYADQAANANTVGNASLTDLVEQILGAPQDLSNRLPKSGFFQQDSPTAYYPCNGWTHLINCQHSNGGNNYALQIAGGFYDQNLFFRKTNGNGTTGWKQFATTDAVLPLTGGTLNGDLTANQFHAKGWFRSYDSNGWYHETHGGGWHMTDDTWIRAYNGKNVYTTGVFQADGGFNGWLHGTADFATLLNPLSGSSDYKLGYTADGQRTNAGEWGRVVMRYAPNGQTYGVRVDRADYADNAGAVNGYSADALRNRASGRNTPILTPLLDKGQGKEINTNKGAGIQAQGNGDLHLTQSYQNFDKILICWTNDGVEFCGQTLWEKWELDYAFNNTYRFTLYKSNSSPYWNIWSSVKLGTTDHPLSTPTLWRTQDQESSIKEIYGLTY